MTTNNFPDGCAPVKNSGGTVYPAGEFFIPNPPAPEEQVAEFTGQDNTWIAGVGGAQGLQPITADNPNGDFAGVSPMNPGLMTMFGDPRSAPGNQGGGN